MRALNPESAMIVSVILKRETYRNVIISLCHDRSIIKIELYYFLVFSSFLSRFIALNNDFLSYDNRFAY